jgi:hypothetical protein
LIDIAILLKELAAASAYYDGPDEGFYWEAARQAVQLAKSR